MTEQTHIDASPNPAEANGSDDGSDAQSRTAGTAGKSSTFLHRLSGLFRPKNGSSIREDLADALDEHSLDSAGFSPGERAMLKNILRLRELRVEDVMIPRADIQSVEITTTLGDLMVIFERIGHSRMPVYGETLDDPRGMIHIRDVIAHITRVAGQKQARATKKPLDAAALDLANIDLTKSIGELSLVRKLLFVPPSMLASDLMARMQAERLQMALVIDEYGGTDGLVSLEDVVEMVVGDIEDEHDEEVEGMLLAIDDGMWDADARVELEEVAQHIDPRLAVVEEDVDTLGGLAFVLAGRVLAAGESVSHPSGWRLEATEADARRVRRMRLHAPAGAGDVLTAKTVRPE